MADRGPQKPWTTREERVLREMYATGARACAESLGRSVAAIHARAQKIGLAKASGPNRPWLAEEDAALRAAADDGRLIREIADQLGRSYYACSTRSQKLGLQFASYEKSAAAARRAVKLRDKQSHGAKISAAFTPERRARYAQLAAARHERGEFPATAPRTPEGRARAIASLKAMWASRTPEQCAEIYARRSATRAANKAARAFGRLLAEQGFGPVVEAVRWAAMTPFERQLERARNGARIEERLVLRTADPDMTLGGVASYGG